MIIIPKLTNKEYIFAPSKLTTKLELAWLWFAIVSVVILIVLAILSAISLISWWYFIYYYIGANIINILMKTYNILVCIFG